VNDLVAIPQGSALIPMGGILAITCLAEAILVASLLARWTGAPAPHDLRGYLAFSVFLFHSSIWYFFLRTNGSSLLRSGCIPISGRRVSSCTS
jgi:hypothetical protein